MYFAAAGFHGGRTKPEDNYVFSSGSDVTATETRAQPVTNFVMRMRRNLVSLHSINQQSILRKRDEKMTMIHRLIVSLSSQSQG